MIIAVVLLAGLGVAVLIALRPATDGLERYPHAFISGPGYDAAQITYIHAPIERPPVAPAGMEIAWVCNDPQFNDQQGRPWLFPVAPSEKKPVLPTHPQLKRRPELETCAIYRSDEAQKLLAAYRTRQGK
ncbi:MAG TPA: hypothetical protein DCS97_04485 [Planctomycetes bacterium]|nr:hypothetical protein [Planctomycetota bacterium]